MAESSSSFRLSLPNGASHYSSSSSHDSSSDDDDDERSSDLLSGSPSNNNDDNNTDAAQKEVMTPVVILRPSLDVSAAMATHGSGGGGKGGYGVVGRQTTNICDKSYAAATTIATNTAAATATGARPSLQISEAAATFGSGSKRVVVALRNAGGMGGGGSDMFRTYDRDYAADKRQNKKKRPLERLLDRSIEKKKTKIIIAEEEEEEEDCIDNRKHHDSMNNNDVDNDDDDEDDQTKALDERVKEFRNSFETNKYLSRKNRESFKVIAQNMEHLGSEIIATTTTTAPIIDVRARNTTTAMYDGAAGVFEVDDIDARGGQSQSQFSECTLTQAFGGCDRRLARDDDDDDDDNDENDINENDNVEEDENDNGTNQVGVERDGNNTGRSIVNDDGTLLVMAVKQNIKGVSSPNFSCSPIVAQDSQQTVPLLPGFNNDFDIVEKSINTEKSLTNETKGVTFKMGTAIDDTKNVIATNLQQVGAAKRGVVPKKRGRMGGATALALAAECGESRDNDEDKEDGVDVQGNSKKRNKRGGVTALALADNEDLASLATTAKLVLAACGSTKYQDRVVSRAFFEHEHVEEGGLPDTSEPNVRPSESFTETEEMQSSEPLLSLSVPLDAPYADKKATNEMIRNVRTHYDEMGKALMCPICQSTLKKAIVLPCVHAFCKACLDDYFNPPMPTRKERKKKSSPPRKIKKECPVCKTPNSGRRSGEESEHLDQTVTSFKTIGRSFSFAPVKYAPGIVMTQLQPTYEDSESEDDDEDDDDKKMSGEKRISHIHEFEEHYQVAKAVQRAFSDPVEEAESQMHTRATEIDDRMINRNRQIAKEQEAVVNADEQFLNREVKRLVEKKHATTSRKDDISPSTSNNEIDQSEYQVAATNTTELANDLEAKHIVGVTSKALEQDNRDESIANKSSVENIIGNNHDEEVEDATSTVDEDEFCTAPDDSQVMYDTSIEESQAASSLNVTIIHDGNTAKKADRPGSRDISSMRNPRESVATAATDRSSPIVLHDGNTVKKMSHRQQSTDDDDDDGVSFHNSYSGNDNPAPMHSENLSMAPLAVYDSVESTNSNVPTTTVTSLRPTEQERIITKGTIVFVQARTWPGINKPGGVARVTKVHAAVDNGGNSIKYDVTYILGGKESRVDESFITINEVDELSTVEEGLETSMTTAGSMSPEKKRLIRQRRAAMKPEPRSHAAASFPIYNDEELKHIPDDVLRWAGIVPKKKGKTDQGESDSSSKHDASKGKKRVLKESNLTSSKSTKKLKPTAKALVKGAGKSSAASVKGFSEIINSLSTEELNGLADARYSQLLSLDEKHSTSDTQLTLYAVTSTLSDKESDMLDSLCKLLKGKSVILKVMKDFSPDKTQICITATGEIASGHTDVVSKSRTLKVMRSALMGIPILTPVWMEACLKAGRIVAPTGQMCVRSLPMKETSAIEGDVNNEMNSGPRASFGVAKYAASFHKSELTNHLLNGMSMMLCGFSAGSGTSKDLKSLLQHTDATIINSIPNASRILTNMSTEKSPLVFLCGDSPANKTCGISDGLFRQAVNTATELKNSAVDGIPLVMCVHFSWLFDSISCASPLTPMAYEPSTWKAALESELTGGKKSQ